MKSELYKAIERKANDKAYDMAKTYMAKKHGDYDLFSDPVEDSFNKTIMVNLEGEWYRCEAIVDVDYHVNFYEGSYFEPSSSEDVFDVKVNLKSVKSESTKKEVA